ncbi:hypothetical protein WJX84_005453 [Apatococcus fuscideae]|uniref:Acid phosphatase/vanadium-dependent haloperoxidase-related protein n=1 Tax=Apatococcus fuscideae TaxID=2026836 RepID=A0AAW1TA74_9CHLO
MSAGRIERHAPKCLFLHPVATLPEYRLYHQHRLLDFRCGPALRRLLLCVDLTVIYRWAIENRQAIGNQQAALQQPAACGSGGSYLLAASSGVKGMLFNGPFIAAFCAFAIAQLLKIFTFWYTDRKWEMTRVVGSGGMPSSHTAMVVALTTALGVISGTNSNVFAIGLVFSLVVMYDASGVRLHAGRQASVLNMIITELPPDHPVSDTRPLRDTLGHTPLQVAVGAMLGMVIGYIVGVSWHTSS